MTEGHPGNEHRPEGATYSRRDLLRRFGLAGAAVAVGPAVLAACGGSSSTKATGSGSSTSASSSSASSSGGTSGDVGAQLQQLLQIDPNGKNGKGQTVQMGAVLALTGNGSYYGKTMTQAINLAVKHIAAAGGPTIQPVYKDHKSGDAQAGVQATTELGTAKVPCALASYAADLGVMLQGIAQYQMFTMDGGGGTSFFGQDKPFFWGTRAITPNDAFAGLFEYIKKTMPNAKTVGVAGWDVGEPANSQGKALFQKQVAPSGLKWNGLYELFPPNTTDYSAVLTKVQANAPDILLLGCYGQDPGFFYNQFQTANIPSKVFGFEFTPDGVKASKGAYDSAGWNFSYDYFDAAHVGNPFGKLFVSEYRKAYGSDPDFYAANYYEDTFGMWELMRRVLANGGDITSGPALEAAMVANPTLHTVYGASSTVDTFSCDPTTHTVTKRSLGVFEYKGGKVTPKAYFGLNATDFRLA